MISAADEYYYFQASMLYYDFQSSAEMPDWIYVDGEREEYQARMLSVYTKYQGVTYGM